MKKFIFITMLIVLATAISLSCKKENAQKMVKEETANSATLDRNGGDRFQLSVNPLSIAEINEIKNNLIPYLDLNNRPPEGSGISTTPIYTNVTLTNHEIAIKSILQPLIDNGKEIYDELMLYVQEIPEWQELNETEQDAILNMSSESQYVQLALMYGTTRGELGGLDGGATVEGISGAQIVNCLAVVCGIYFINDLVSGVFTWGAGLSLAKFLIRRYMSYLAMALLVYDLVECLAG